jgi:hypothetical protein
MPSIDYETRRRLIILLLIGLIAVLAFSLYALYDYHFKYERSDDPISYERDEYIEFYFKGNDTYFAAYEFKNVTIGVANFLEEDKDLTIIWESDPNGTYGYHNFSIKDKEVKHIDLQLRFDKSEDTVIYLILTDEEGTELSRIEREFAPIE